MTHGDPEGRIFYPAPRGGGGGGNSGLVLVRVCEPVF